MKEVIRDHELTVTPRSLMTATGKLHYRGEGKSDLVKVITSHCKLQKANDISPDCAAIDGMALLYSWKLPKSVLHGKDLGDAFCHKVLELAGTSSTIILCFDTYSEHSLKSGTWEVRVSKKVGEKKDLHAVM